MHRERALSLHKTFHRSILRCHYHYLTDDDEFMTRALFSVYFVQREFDVLVEKKNRCSNKTVARHLYFRVWCSHMLGSARTITVWGVEVTPHENVNAEIRWTCRLLNFHSPIKVTGAQRMCLMAFLPLLFTFFFLKHFVCAAFGRTRYESCVCCRYRKDVQYIGGIHARIII